MEGRITNLQGQLRDRLDTLKNRALPRPQDDED